MPEPPDVGWLTRHLFENPYPVALAALAIAAGLAWIGLRDARRDRLVAAAVLAALGGSALLTGALVTTAGERARVVAQDLVAAAVDGDIPAAMRLLDDEAILAFGSPKIPGFGLDFIHDRLTRLTERHPVVSNRTTMLKAYTESPTRATVHLACLTEVEAGYGLTASKWVLRIEPDADGILKVVHITCVSINGRTPRPEWAW